MVKPRSMFKMGVVQGALFAFGGPMEEDSYVTVERLSPDGFPTFASQLGIPFCLDFVAENAGNCYEESCHSRFLLLP